MSGYRLYVQQTELFKQTSSWDVVPCKIPQSGWYGYYIMNWNLIIIGCTGVTDFSSGALLFVLSWMQRCDVAIAFRLPNTLLIKWNIALMLFVFSLVCLNIDWNYIRSRIKAGN